MTRGPTPHEGPPPADADADFEAAPEAVQAGARGRRGDVSTDAAVPAGRASLGGPPPGPDAQVGPPSAGDRPVDGSARTHTAAKTPPYALDGARAAEPRPAPRAAANHQKQANEGFVHADALQSRAEALGTMDARLARPAAKAFEDRFTSLERTDPDVDLAAVARASGDRGAHGVADDGAEPGAADEGHRPRDLAGPSATGTAGNRVPAGDAPDTAHGASRPDLGSEGAGAAGSAAAPSPPSDPALNQYIASLHLTDLDLSEVELPPAAAPSLAAFGACTAAGVAGLVALLWLPSTALYQLHAAGEVLFWLAAAGVAAAGWVGARHWPAGRQFLTALAASDGAQDKRTLPPPPRWLRRLFANRHLQTRLLAWRRPLLGTGIVALAACVAFVLPREPEWAGNTYSTAWFVAVVAAMSCGILVGRFILAQAAASPLARELEPFSPPTWLRWVSLGLLVAGATVTNFGAQWFNLAGYGSEFPLAGLGLVTGIGGAIWLARRFDELEAKWRDEAQAQAQRPDAAEAGGQER